MRICVYGMNFHPEEVGIGVYTYDMCRFFREAGHEVEVVTSQPFYPTRPADGGTARREVFEGMTIRRYRGLQLGHWRAWSRILHEVTFAMVSAPGLLRMRRPDVVVAVSPGFVPAVTGVWLATLRGIPTVVHVQDLQLDAAGALRMINSRFVLRVLSLAERSMYRRATVVSTLDTHMRDRLLERGATQTQAVVFPNWVDEVEEGEHGGPRFRAQHGLGTDFAVVYSGSMGAKHGLEFILEVAREGRHDRSTRFVLIGEGGQRDRLEKLAVEMQLTNVMFLPLQPRSEFSAVTAAGDLFLIPQRPVVGNLVVPSKLLRILAAGRPIVAAAQDGGGLATAVRESGAGVVVPFSDPAAAWRAIERLKADAEERRRMGRAGRAYVFERFGRQRVLTEYLEVLRRIGRQAQDEEANT
jgi:colanic acid biosynthesis glycosyl transferase WcaI